MAIGCGKPEPGEECVYTNENGEQVVTQAIDCSVTGTGSDDGCCQGSKCEVCDGTGTGSNVGGPIVDCEPPTSESVSLFVTIINSNCPDLVGQEFEIHPNASNLCNRQGPLDPPFDQMEIWTTGCRAGDNRYVIGWVRNGDCVCGPQVSQILRCNPLLIRQKTYLTTSNCGGVGCPPLGACPQDNLTWIEVEISE